MLLRESYREAGKVKNRTLANLSSWPEAKVDALARVLKGQPPPAADLDGAFEITRSLPHGHVAAVLGTARQLGLEELIDPVPSRHRDLVVAMAVAQVIAPASKLAIARGLRDATAATSLGEVLHLGGCDEDDLYEAMDYLHDRQDTNAGTRWPPATWPAAPWCCMTSPPPRSRGRTCPLGAIGHPKTRVRGRLQIVYGLLTSSEGIPVAIEVFAGKPATPRPSPTWRIAAACARARLPLRGKDKIAVRADRTLNRRKVASTSPSRSPTTACATSATEELHRRRGKTRRHLRAAHQRPAQ